MKKIILFLLITFLSVKLDAQCTGVTMASQPSDVNATLGGTATFTVTVNGDPPFLYFWYKGSTQVNGPINSSSNSNSFTTPTLVAGNNGDCYHCIITNCNSMNQAISAEGCVNINSCTSVTMANQPLNVNATLGGTATFTVTVNGDPPFLYFWYKGSTQVNGPINSSSNTNSYTTPPLSASNNGDCYNCIITNCNSMSQAISSDGCLNISGVGIKETSNSNNFVIQPNPNNGIFSFDFFDGIFHQRNQMRICHCWGLVE